MSLYSLGVTEVSARGGGHFRSGMFNYLASKPKGKTNEKVVRPEGTAASLSPAGGSLMGE